MGKKKRLRSKIFSPETLEGILGRAGEDRFAKQQVPIPLHVWVAAVGRRIATRARPVTFERGVLTIRVATSAWANELSLLSAEMRARLGERGIRVTEFFFRVGAVEPIGEPALAKKVVTRPAELSSELLAALDTIEDEELREAVATAASESLGRSRALPE